MIQTSIDTTVTSRREGRVAGMASNAVVALSAVFLYGLATILTWQPILRVVADGASLQGTIKNYFLYDQLTYLSIAQNVSAGRGAHIEPMTATGNSIYPSAYYTLLGWTSALTHKTTFFSWNVVGMVMTVLFMMVVGKVGSLLSGNKWGWLVGPIPLLASTLSWYTDNSWQSTYGQHAVLWPTNAIAFNPGAEIPALCIGFIALAFFFKGLTNNISWKQFAISGLFLGLCMEIHTYVFLFFLAVLACSLFAHALLTAFSRTATLTSGICIALGALLIAVKATSMALGLYALLIAAILAPLFIVRSWRNQYFRAVLAFGIGLAITALPLLIRIAADATSSNSFLKFRQQNAQGLNLSLPLGPTLLQTAPVLLVVLFAIVDLVQKRRNGQHFAHAIEPIDSVWLATLIGGLIATFLMTFNAAWHMNQEPYRFYPYGFALLTTLSAAWIFRSWKTWSSTALRVVAISALAATLPTSLSFAHATSHETMTVSAQEREGFVAIADHLPKNGVALLDGCMPARQITSLSDANVADYNLGLAIPSHYAGITSVLSTASTGTLPSNAQLQTADVTSFVSATTCPNDMQTQAQKRYGSPVVIPLRDAVSLGLPATTSYLIYAVR